MTTYKYTGPVDCSVEPDLSKVKGKSAIVTGGEYTSRSRMAGSDVRQAPLALAKDTLKHW